MNEEKPEKVGITFPVLKSTWDGRTPDDEKFWEGIARASLDRVAIEIGELIRDVAESGTIDGLRLHRDYDEDGNELPDYVMLRYTAMAHRRPEGD